MVSIWLPNLCWYFVEDIYIAIDQDEEPYISLCGIQERMLFELSEPMYRQSYNYSTAKMTELFSADFKTAEATADWILLKQDGQTGIKHDFN